MNSLSMNKKAITVAILDNQIDLLDGLSFRFSHCDDLKVVITSPNPDEFLELVAAHKPQVAIVDLGFDWRREVFRFDVIESIAKAHPETKIIVYTGYASLEKCVRALRAGAMAFVAKDNPTPPDIPGIVRIVAAGGKYIEPALDKDLGKLLMTPENEPSVPGGSQKLSPREDQVLTLWGQGQRTKQIAQALKISPHTVRATTNSIRQKLRVHTMAEAVLIIKARKEDQ